MSNRVCGFLSEWSLRLPSILRVQYVEFRRKRRLSEQPGMRGNAVARSQSKLGAAHYRKGKKRKGAHHA